MQTTDASAQDSTTGQRRELAIKRLKAKDDFKKHLLAYLAVSSQRIAGVWLRCSILPLPSSLRRLRAAPRHR